MEHSVLVKTPCVRCIRTGDHIIGEQIGHERSLRESKMVEKRVSEISRKHIASVLDETEIFKDERRDQGEDLLKPFSVS